jgi:hypothetical protein
MQSIPLFDIGTGGKSANVSAQSRTNLYCEQPAQPDKSPLQLYARPGLSAATGLAWSTTVDTTLGVAGQPGPIRGACAAQWAPSASTLPQTQQAVMVAVGNAIYIATDSGGALLNQLYSTYGYQVAGTGPVSIAQNGKEFLAVDGTRGLLFSFNGGTTGPVVDVDFPTSPTSVCFIAGRFIVNDSSSAGRFRWSALLDGSSWDPLDFATAESSPDILTAVFEARGELMLFGSQSIEFWAPTGDTDIFRRIGSTGAQWGCSAPASIKKLEQSVVFLGRQSGDKLRRVCVLDGYSPRPVSTPDVEVDIMAETDANLDAVTAVVQSIAGHTFYVLNLSTKTWAYDFSNGAWSRWETSGTRYAVNYDVNYRGQQFLFSWNSKDIYTAAEGVYTDNSAVLAREVTTRHTSSGMDRIACHEIVLDVEFGVGLTSGQGVAPQIMMQVSKDGGHTWGREQWRSLGAIGNYRGRAKWLRQGAARDWIFKFRVTDPVKVVIIGGYGRFDG